MGQKCCKNTDDEVGDIRRNSKHPPEIRAGGSMNVNMNENSSPKAIGDSMMNSVADSNLQSPGSAYKSGLTGGALGDRSSFHFEDGETNTQQ